MTRGSKSTASHLPRINAAKMDPYKKPWIPFSKWITIIRVRVDKSSSGIMQSHMDSLNTQYTLNYRPNETDVPQNINYPNEVA